LGGGGAGGGHGSRVVSRRSRVASRGSRPELWGDARIRAAEADYADCPVHRIGSRPRVGEGLSWTPCPDRLVPRPATRGAICPRTNTENHCHNTAWSRVTQAEPAQADPPAPQVGPVWPGIRRAHRMNGEAGQFWKEARDQRSRRTVGDGSGRNPDSPGG